MRVGFCTLKSGFGRTGLLIEIEPAGEVGGILCHLAYRGNNWMALCQKKYHLGYAIPQLSPKKLLAMVIIEKRKRQFRLALDDPAGHRSA
jgi:hypothetical protein